MTSHQKTLDALRQEVITAAVELFEGDRQAALGWLNRPLPAIGHEAPASYMSSPEKIQEVRDIIGRLEHGVWI